MRGCPSLACFKSLTLRSSHPGSQLAWIQLWISRMDLIRPVCSPQRLNTKQSASTQWGLQPRGLVLCTLGVTEGRISSSRFLRWILRCRLLLRIATWWHVRLTCHRTYSTNSKPSKVPRPSLRHWISLCRTRSSCKAQPTFRAPLFISFLRHQISTKNQLFA